MKHRHSPMIVFIILGCLGASQSQAAAKVVLAPILESSLALSSATISTTPASGAYTLNQQSLADNFYLLAAPNLGFTDWSNLWITPSVEVEYFGTDNVLNIEDESFVFKKTFRCNTLLGGNYQLGKTWQFKLKGFYNIDLNQRPEDETLAGGLFSFYDLGFWAEMRAAYTAGSWPMRTKWGYKSYERKYPHATNAEQIAAYELAGLTTAGLPAGLHDLDIGVHEGWLRQEMTWDRQAVLTNVELRGKWVNYHEQPIILPGPVISPQQRQDQYLDIFVEFPFLINSYHQLELDGGFRARHSNQHFYDPQQDVYLPAYFDYYQYRLRLLYSFTFAFKVAGQTPKGALLYTLQSKQFPHRPAYRFIDAGATQTAYFFDSPHWELSHDLGLTLKQALWVSWAHVFLSVHVISQASNSTAPATVLNNFTYRTFTLGMAVKF